MGRALFVMALALAAYLALAGQASLNECIAGLIVAGSATVWLYGVGKVAERHYRFAIGDFASTLASLGSLPKAIVATGYALCRALPSGRLDAGSQPLPFEVGSERDERAAARRAAAVIAQSLAPDGYVLRHSPGRSEFLVHRLTKKPSLREGAIR